jgi:C2 domain
MTVPDILTVVSAEIARSILTKSSNLYVEIRLDGAAMQHTRAIKGPVPNWNEEFRMYV